jgi:hypothetical protein
MLTGGNSVKNEPSQPCMADTTLETRNNPAPQNLSRMAPEKGGSKKTHMSTDRLSIVNLLYDDESSVPESNSKLSATVTAGFPSERSRPASSSAERDQHQIRKPNAMLDVEELAINRNADKIRQETYAQAYKRGTSLDISASDSFGRSRAELSLEKEYFRLFFTNLYYIHPFLSYTTFSARCETNIWSQWPLTRISRDEMHFLALYNIILAVGSLTGSLETFSNFKKQLDEEVGVGHSDVISATSSIQLSKIFLGRSKRLLGDCFEVCSLESAQTLILIVSYLLRTSYSNSKN